MEENCSCWVVDCACSLAEVPTRPYRSLESAYWEVALLVVAPYSAAVASSVVAVRKTAPKMESGSGAQRDAPGCPVFVVRGAESADSH